MSTQSQSPREVIRLMAPQIFNLRSVVGYHFKRRHTTHTKAGVRSWISEVRRICRDSGYSNRVRQIGDPAYPAYRPTPRPLHSWS